MRRGGATRVELGEWFEPGKRKRLRSNFCNFVILILKLFFTGVVGGRNTKLKLKELNSWLVIAT